MICNSVRLPTILIFTIKYRRKRDDNAFQPPRELQYHGDAVENEPKEVIYYIL